MTTAPSRRSLFDEIRPYTPDPRRCDIDLSDNTNLWGSPPAASRAAMEDDAPSFARYPEVYSETLKDAIASYTGVPADRIVTGCGSDDILDLAIRAIGEPGDRLVLPDPAFVMIPAFARVNGLTPIAVPVTSAYDVDVEATLAVDASIVYLASPNNPTGTEFSRAAMEAIVDRAPGLVVVDEAYFEFSSGSMVDLIERSDRLLVVRTLSKAFGLAGLRVGYGIGAPRLIAQVQKSRGPYKLSSVAARVATAALTADVPWVMQHVGIAVENRTRLASALGELGLTTLPSSANFLLVPVRQARAVAAHMRTLGVAVRPFSNIPTVTSALAASGGEALRITVGPWEMLEQALVALREALAACA